jgi:hypothetical protein
MNKQRWTADPYQVDLAIYNDLPTDKFIAKLYPDEKTRMHTRLEGSKRAIDLFIESQALPGEQFKTIEIEEYSVPFVISSKGRVLSVYRDMGFRQMKIHDERGIETIDSNINVVPLERLMEEAGFEYDMQKILKLYWETEYPILRWPNFALEMISQ